jgi:hypothetical protein
MPRSQRQEGRFASVAVTSDAHLARVSRYIPP